MTRLGFHRDWYPLIVGVLIVVGFEFALILWTTQGNFTYTLDDPYIHLALAENLARFGHYGLNVEEYSSPSSSILWPFLLVPLLAIGLGASGPLILNVLFAVASVLVIHQIIVDSAKSPSRPAAERLVGLGAPHLLRGQWLRRRVHGNGAFAAYPGDGRDRLFDQPDADRRRQRRWGAIRLRRFASGVLHCPFAVDPVRRARDIRVRDSDVGRIGEVPAGDRVRFAHGALSRALFPRHERSGPAVAAEFGAGQIVSRG